MASTFNWTCPTCGRHTTVTEPNYSHGSLDVYCRATVKGLAIQVSAMLIECPNQQCKAQSFSISALHGPVITNPRNGVQEVSPDAARPVGIGNFRFLPVTAQPLSGYVPRHVLADYNEAYLIKSLSPKASATLARRALQGMVRDFFALPKLPSLHAELQAIQSHCDEPLFEAIMAVKSVGNIGAHPERDVSLMVEVEPDEPETLLNLIHLLDQEWYVARADRQQRIEKMKALGAAKAAAKA